MARRPMALIALGDGVRLGGAFAVIDRDVGARFGERQRDGRADAAGGAGDEGDAVGQVEGHGAASLLSRHITVAETGI